ncbi:hypothetical protein [Fretibacter rubidus]|uniref:hypothetical protein n=1 Tax=Fretibacter rubidus TaxID=570162 RepID=UPI00352BC569
MAVLGTIDINITADGFVEATVHMTDENYNLIPNAVARDIKLSWCEVSKRSNKGQIKHNVQRKLHLGTIGTCDFPVDAVMFYSAKVLTRPKTGFFRFKRYRRLLGTAAVENSLPATLTNTTDATVLPLRSAASKGAKPQTMQPIKVSSPTHYAAE